MENPPLMDGISGGLENPLGDSTIPSNGWVEDGPWNTFEHLLTVDFCDAEDPIRLLE